MPISRRYALVTGRGGHWAVNAGDGEQAALYTRCEASAVRLARRIVAALGGGEIVVRGPDGAARDSFMVIAVTAGTAERR